MQASLNVFTCIGRSANDNGSNQDSLNKIFVNQHFNWEDEQINQGKSFWWTWKNENLSIKSKFSIQKPRTFIVIYSEHEENGWSGEEKKRTQLG